VPGRAGRTLYDYLAGFWDPAGNYVRARALQGRPLSADYLVSMRSAVKRHVLRWLEETKRTRLPLGRATAGTLEELVLRLHEGGLSARRVNGIRQSVGVALAEAKRLGMISRNPMPDVLKLAETKPKRELLSLEEVHAFFALPWEDRRQHVANLTAATTGLRLREIRGLQADDIKAGYLHVCHNWQDGEGLKEPKWGSQRDVPLPARTEAALWELAGRNPWQTGFVFYGTRADVPIGKRTLSEGFNAAIRAVGIPEPERRRLTFHSWRHWYNSMLRGKVPDHALRALTGHQAEAMTERYTAVTEEQRQAVAALAEKLISK
jgi:integrase